MIMCILPIWAQQADIEVPYGIRSPIECCGRLKQEDRRQAVTAYVNVAEDCNYGAHRLERVTHATNERSIIWTR